MSLVGECQKLRLEVLAWVKSQRVLQAILRRFDVIWKAQGAFEELERMGAIGFTF